MGPFVRVLAALQATYAMVPALWPFEIVSVLEVAERRKRITQEGIAKFLNALRRLPIQVERREALWLRVLSLATICNTLAAR
jgi:hypothetical protein